MVAIEAMGNRAAKKARALRRRHGHFSRYTPPGLVSSRRRIVAAGFACPCGDMSETEEATAADLGPCLTCGSPGFTVCPACGVRCAECFIDQMQPR